MHKLPKVLVTLGFLGAVAAPGALEAQTLQTENGLAAMNYGATPNLERARELQTQAEALYSQPAQWKKAARLLERSAELRTASDPEVYTCLFYAGRLRAAVNDMAGSRINLEKAATHALSHGAIIEAAHAFIDAAHVASAENDVAAAREFLKRAAMLSESPLLSAEQKQFIQARLKA